MKLKKIAKTAALLVLIVAVIGAVLYVLGLRLVLDGGGGVSLAFAKSASKQAEEVAKHREAQRAQPSTAPPTGSASYWTSFRGPERDGHYRQLPVRTDWPEGGLKPLWKQPIGGGYASFVIADGRAFTIEQRGAQEMAS